MEWTNSVDLNSVQFYIQNIYGNFNWLSLTFLKDTSYDNHTMKTAVSAAKESQLHASNMLDLTMLEVVRQLCWEPVC